MVLKYKVEKRGEHVHVYFYSGQNKDHLAHNGKLVFLVGEFQLFSVALLIGQEGMKGRLEVIDEGYLSSGWAEEEAIKRASKKPRRPAL